MEINQFDLSAIESTYKELARQVLLLALRDYLTTFLDNPRFYGIYAPDKLAIRAECETFIKDGWIWGVLDGEPENLLKLSGVIIKSGDESIRNAIKILKQGGYVDDNRKNCKNKTT